MATILDFDTSEVVEETPSGAWYGSHLKPRRSLWVILQNGHRHNYPWYAYQGATLQGGRLTMYFAYATISITGRHLRPLAELIASNGAFYVCEQHASHFDVPDEEPFIDRIDIGPPNTQELWKKP